MFYFSSCKIKQILIASYFCIAKNFNITKINEPLGIYHYHPQAKTAKAEYTSQYWSVERFHYLEDFINQLTSNARRNYIRERDEAYRRLNSFNETSQQFIKTGKSKTLDDAEKRDIVRKSLTRVGGEIHDSKQSTKLGCILTLTNSTSNLSEDLMELLRKEYHCDRFVVLLSHDYDYPTTNEELATSGFLVFRTILNVNKHKKNLFDYLGNRFFYNIPVLTPKEDHVWIYKDNQIRDIQELIQFMEDHEYHSCGSLSQIADSASGEDNDLPSLIDLRLFKGGQDIHPIFIHGLLKKEKFDQEALIDDGNVFLINQISHQLSYYRKTLSLIKNNNDQYKKLEKELTKVKQSYSFRIGSALIRPIELLKQLWNRHHS